MRFADLAKAAETAWRAPGKDDVVAFLDIGDAFADFLDDAAPFMPEQEGKVVGAENAVLGGKVGVAHAAGENANQRFARTGMRNQKFFDHAGLVRCARDDAFCTNWISHDALSVRSCRCPCGGRNETPLDGGHRARVRGDCQALELRRDRTQPLRFAVEVVRPRCARMLRVGRSWRNARYRASVPASPLGSSSASRRTWSMSMTSSSSAVEHEDRRLDGAHLFLGPIRLGGPHLAKVGQELVPPFRLRRMRLIPSRGLPL